jgi:excisionase family DNA binding protein
MDSTAPAPRVDLLKIDEVARHLQISRTQAYRLCQSGSLPAVRFGSLVRVRPSDLELFVITHLAQKPEPGDGDPWQRH